MIISSTVPPAGIIGSTNSSLAMWQSIHTGLSVSFGIQNQGIHQFQNVLFAVNIQKRVIVHAFLKIDRVQDADLISFLSQKSAAANNQVAFGISHNIRAVALQKIRQDKESGFSAAGAADDQHVFIPRIGRILRPVGKHQAFRLCQDDVLTEVVVHKRLNIFGCAPAG